MTCICYLVSFFHVLSDFVITYYETDITGIVLNLCFNVKVVAFGTEQGAVMAIVNVVVNIWVPKLWGISRASKNL